MGAGLALLLAGGLLLPPVLPVPAAGLEAGCGPAAERRPAPEPTSLRVPGGAGAAASTPAGSDTYAHRLASTPLGWPRLDQWCVWLEPAVERGPSAPWDRRWVEAVEAALERWGALVPIRRVADPEAAQVRIRRRRPPLRQDGQGRTRASHGRAMLQLQAVQRGGIWRLEPVVEVLLSPGQRALALEATALHELGHAFGLWGHSSDPADAMAAVPGADPVTELSPRDRATLRWLYRQPTPFGRPIPEPERP